MVKSLQDLIMKDDSFKKLIKQGDFIGPDPKLIRYSKDRLRDYIEFCCEKQYFIEAYSLTVQYVKDLLVYSVKTSKKNINAISVLATLSETGIVSKEFEKLFHRVNSRRNRLTHEVIRNPQIKRQISTTEVGSHLTDLFNLIDLAEEFFLKWVHLFPQKFLFIKPIGELKNSQKIKEQLLIGILINKILKEIDIPIEKLTKKGWKAKFNKEFEEKFKRLFIKIFGIKQITNKT